MSAPRHRPSRAVAAAQPPGRAAHRAGSATRGASRASWPIVTWVYMVWAIVPVVIAILFSFNDGRSRSVWQGFSTRWYWGDPRRRCCTTPRSRDALDAQPQARRARHADRDAARRGARARPGALARPRLGPANFLMLFPLVTPEIVMAVSLLLVFTLTLFTLSDTRHDRAGPRPGDVLDLLRGRDRPRPAVLDRQPVRGGRARPRRDAAGALRLVLIPLLLPAISASLLIVFALSIDDFVVTHYMSSNSAATTMPIQSTRRRARRRTPALNALATIMVLVTRSGRSLADFVYTLFTAASGRPGRRHVSATGGIRGI